MRLLEKNLATTAIFSERPSRGGAAPGRSVGLAAAGEALDSRDLQQIWTERVGARRPDDPEGGQSNRYRTRTGRLMEFGCGLSLQAAPALLRRIPRALLTAPHARPRDG
jgi:hypothetical protein